MKILKIAGIIALCLGGIYLLLSFFVLPFFWSLQSRPTESQAERNFNSNRRDLQLITDYLISSNFDEISIRLDSEIDVRSGLTRVSISDGTVNAAIQRLSRRGYRIIAMNEEGVRFLRWVYFEQGRGFAYLPQGRTAEEGEGLLPFMIELEPLSEDGWYFYVEWFSEWRRRQQRSG